MRQAVNPGVAIEEIAVPKKKEARPDSPAMIGRRLRHFREAMEIGTHSKFIKGTGIARSTYVDCENGVARLGLNSAFALIKKYPDLSLDYIYLGRTGAIPSLALQIKIAELMARDNP